MSGYGTHKVTCGNCGDSYEASGSAVGDIDAELWLSHHKARCRKPPPVVPSECGHMQTQPSNFEIDNCPEIIVRVCVLCKTELYWSVDRWQRVVPSSRYKDSRQ